MATVTEALPRTYVEPEEYSGLWSWITTVDHKRIAILYGTTALIWFLIGGIEALLIRTQLWVPGGKVLTAEAYNEMFTMHGTTMIFLGVMPLSVAFFNLVIPLQIGARDVAFPRLNAFSYWVFLFGSLLLNFGFLIGQAPDQGWFGYANLTTKPYSPTLSVDFWMLGLQVLGVASVAGALNFIVTIINMRCPGMSLMRMPLFTWMSFVTAFLLVLAFPVITVGLIELMFDRFFGTNFYNVAKGAEPILWQHLFWVFGHPEVYILILPAMGIVSEILPTFSGKPLFGYPVVVYSGIAIGFMSFGVWAHHMFATGMGPIADAVFAVNTMLIAIPTGVKIFNWMFTMWGGQIRFTTAMKYAIGFIAMFTIGGISGVTHASPPTDLQQTDTYYIVAHFHYVLFGGAILGILGGFYYWFPKMYGRFLSEKIGNWQFWLTFIGFNLTFFPMHWTGMLGMPRRTYTYSAELGVTWLNQLSTIGAFILGIGMLLFVINYIRALNGPATAPADPWDGATLEWAIPSPPPEYNFATIPTVHSATPLWDEKYGGHGPAEKEGPEDEVKIVIAGQELAELGLPDDTTARVEPGRHEAATHHGGSAHALGIHMPNPSYYPLLAALGFTVVFTGLIINPVISVCGVALLFYGIYGWCFEPAG